MIEKVIRTPRFLTFFLLIVSSLALLAGCQRERRDPVIGVAYVSSNAINLRDRLGATQYTVATLKQGERLEILGRQHRWLRVRTAAKTEGWLEERHTVNEDIFHRFEKLRQTAAALPSEGTAHARREVNLHLDPDRKSPTYYALKEDASCEVTRRAFSERPPRPKQDAGKKEYEDWFLVRTAGSAGWGLAGNLDMAVPEDVLQYAEGKRIVAWFVLDPGEGTDPKPMILWAATSGMGLPYDFDSVRVFSWGSKRKRYETAYIEHNLRGYYPIRQDKNPPGFTYIAENKQGEHVENKFVLDGTRVRRASANQRLSHSNPSSEHGGRGKKSGKSRKAR
jgi:SH3-like domain-containing protein